jgi:predicted RNase H-like HicB family nuclease
VTPAEHLAVPYVMTMVPAIGPDGTWLCRAEYPELPNCVAEAFSPIEAIDKLEAAREQFILRSLEHGEPIPTPRPPLRYRIPAIQKERLEFARWLADERRIGEGTGAPDSK